MSVILIDCNSIKSSVWVLNQLSKSILYARATFSRELRRRGVATADAANAADAADSEKSACLASGSIQSVCKKWHKKKMKEVGIEDLLGRVEFSFHKNPLITQLMAKFFNTF